MSAAQEGSENIYYNVVIPGPAVGGQVDGVPAVYDVTRTQPILMDCSKYYASIVRMTVPLNSVPIFVCPILNGIAGQTNPNLTPFVVSIYYNGVQYPIGGVTFPSPADGTNVIWQPEILSWDVPVPVVPGPPPQGIAAWYYYMFSYGTFISIINQAAQVAFTAFAVANPATPQAIAGVAPFLIYDAATQLMSWVWHNSWATTPAQAVKDPVPPVPRVTMNFELQSILDGFRILNINVQNPINTNNGAFVFQNTGNNGYPANTYPAVSTFLFTQQGFNAIALLASLRRIVVTTSSIPIVAEAVPAGNGTVSATSGVAATLPIISDFIPQLTQSNDVRGIAYYEPRAQYRLSNMTRSIPLNNIQVAIFWQDKDGTLHPIIIAREQQASMKLGFFRKSLYGKERMPTPGESHY